MADQRKAQKRPTPWPQAMQAAIQDARREGYLRAIEDVHAAILAGDLHKMVLSVRRREMGEVQPLCLPLETQIAIGR